MGYSEYINSQKLEMDALHMAGNAFYSLLMAAMRQADTVNAHKLRDAFPETHRELGSRYNAPGGHLEGEERT